MRVIPLKLQGVVSSRSDTAGMLLTAGDAVLVERGRPRLLVLVCPCGCGETFATNLDRQAGKAWRLYRKRGSITLFPSVWRDTGCEAHFILDRNQFYLFGRWREEPNAEDIERWINQDAITREAVFHALSRESFSTVTAIADQIDALPWDVLNMCRRLAAEKLVIEGTNEQRGCFRKK